MSKFFWAASEFTHEQLRRNLLLARTLRLPFQDVRGPRVDELRLAADRHRIEFSDSGARERWRASVLGNEQAYEKWIRYFCEAAAKAFAAGKVEIEWHEAGHRISWAWDDGSGLYPQELLPSGALAMSVARMRHYDIVEDHLKSNDWFGVQDGLGHRQFLENIGPEFAQRKLMFDAALAEFAASAPAGTRVGILGENPTQVAWIRGLMTDDLLFDPVSPSVFESVLAVALGESRPNIELDVIPMEPFLDFCESLDEAREAFAVQLEKWTHMVSASPAEERRFTLARISREEVIPAIGEFNVTVGKVVRSILKSVSGADLHDLAVGALAASSFAVAGAGIPAAVGAGTTAVISSALSDGLKAVVANATGRKRHWLTFASALRDQISSWRSRNIYTPL